MDGLNWYVYCGNDPINKLDPTGLNMRSDIKNVWDFALDNIEQIMNYDHAGVAILLYYLYGGGEGVYINNNPSWSTYMQNNKILKAKTKDILLNYFDDMPNGSSQWLDITTSMEIENGEDIVGYQYLHGTNGDLALFKSLGATVDDVGYRIIGEVTKDNKGTVRYNLIFEWNDIIDPNFDYTTDQVKAEIAKKIPGANPQNYILRIRWDVSGKYVEEEGWWFWEEKSYGWPVK